MRERAFIIRNKLGLHARPAALFVQTAARFRCDVQVSKVQDGEEVVVNGKSVMGLMMLAASCGETVRVRLSGPEEGKALTALEELFERNFDED